MKCIAVYHVCFEDLGTFADPIEKSGYAIEYRHAGSEPLTLVEWRTADLVVVLGGPLGVSDTQNYPWLKDELEGLEQRLQLALPTLGICLGAQLMAVTLGGTITRRLDAAGAPAREIGWSTLDLAPGDNPLEQLKGVPVLHWHGDNISLPPHIASLASTPETPYQAFQVGAFGLAMQFHGEFPVSALEEWLTGHAVELASAGVDFDCLRKDTSLYGKALAVAGEKLVTSWLQEFDRT